MLRQLRLRIEPFCIAKNIIYSLTFYISSYIIIYVLIVDVILRTGEACDNVLLSRNGSGLRQKYPGSYSTRLRIFEQVAWRDMFGHLLEPSSEGYYLQASWGGGCTPDQFCTGGLDMFH